MWALLSTSSQQDSETSHSPAVQNLDFNEPDHIKTSSTKEAEYCVITETLLETEKQKKNSFARKLQNIVSKNFHPQEPPTGPEYMQTKPVEGCNYH